MPEIFFISYRYIPVNKIRATISDAVLLEIKYASSIPFKQRRLKSIKIELFLGVINWIPTFMRKYFLYVWQWLKKNETVPQRGIK